MAAVSRVAEQLNASLAGRYAIQRELGRGGMATVFLASDLRHHQRAVAIKVLDPELAAAIGPERFLREIEFVAGLSHAHILPLYESGAADGLLFYVMPYIAGGSLRQCLEREKQLPVADALRITGEVAGVLDYAHRQGVVHRDIKPENILLQEEHAVVADFGIARALVAAGGGQRTAPGVPIGTPAYMSPEQWVEARDVDGRSDQYSLGCVLYEMLAGQPPFTGPTVDSIDHQHRNATPRPVTDLRPTVPEPVARVIGRALAKTPADRFRSAAEFARALAEAPAATPAPVAPAPGDSRAVMDAVVGEPRPTESPTPTPPTPGPRKLRRLTLVGGVVVAVAVGVWVLWPDRPEPRAEHLAIAVLPFQNLSAEGPHAYFAPGLHDEILTQLSKVTALKVISRTSVRGYESTSKPLKTIASELGVGSVVEGSVQVVGEQLRVNVQLIEAATDEHLWAERYDRTLDDAFAIQSEVAQAIVVAVGARLTSDEQGRIATPPTANAEAYRLHLQGTEYLVRPGYLKENVEVAQQLFERALALDPNFTIAHASLSRTHSFMYWWGHDPSPARLARAKAEAEVAHRLAPDLPETHWAIGWTEYVSTRGLTEGTRRRFRRAADEFAIALKGLPNDAELWRFSGVTHRRLGNWTEVTVAFERAAQLDPRGVNTFYYLGGHTFRVLRRYPDAIRSYERALSLAPDLPEVSLSIGYTYIQWQGQVDSMRAILGRLPRDGVYGFGLSVAVARADVLLYERAADSLLQMPEMARRNLAGNEQSFVPSALYAAWAHRLRGDQAAARAAFDSARVHLDSRLREHPDDWGAHRDRGLALAGLGRRGEALREARWLEQTGIYREDANAGSYVATGRAMILAQVGDADPAIDELDRLLAIPSDVSVQTLRLDPLWNPIREHPRFKALLTKYGS